MWTWVKLPKAIALIAFALPWLTVSCSSTVLLTASGWSLATGRLAVVDPLSDTVRVQAGQPSMVLIVAFAIVAIGLLSSLMGRRRAVVVLCTSLAALALVIVGTHRFGTTLMREELHKRQPGADAERFARQIRIDRQPGYWIELAALIAAAGMAGMVVAGRDQAGRRALGEDDDIRS